ncbi:2-dehydro-3-deoxygalactonokinase [Devosia submarina]|uniref:2-dehydro-3-deoxygalactonokinase n=1 Tax=Devosia submarina TaxID=1173082 RepID=UPI0013004FD5|nr:2-dehydro-3-deoxygalactonokinase [Devosia submarina]
MFITVEWTSSAFHAWRMAANGAVLAEHKSQSGVNSVREGAFEAVLRAELGAWLPDSEAILLSGMVTSRTGWVESPFAIVPAGISELFGKAERRDIGSLPPIYFLPGIARQDPLPDVMRGEEMAIFGIEGTLPELIVLPGAHSKWVRTDGQRIVDLSTYMSGEILNLLRKDSLLSKLIPADYAPSEAAFDRGVAIARDKGALPGGVLQRLFSARSLVLFDQLKPHEISDYLSGVLIGSEIAEVLAGQPDLSSVVILGETPVAYSYRRALQQFGTRSPVKAGSAAAGFARLIVELSA